MSNITGDTIFGTRSSEHFGNKLQTLENNKSSRPAASCFHQFSRVWNPNKTLELVFEILHISQVTYRRERNKEFSLAKKQLKSAKRIIEPWIKLYIYKRRAFHRLNHWLISNRTGEIYFSLLAATLQKKIRLSEWYRERKKIFACRKTSQECKANHRTLD